MQLSRKETEDTPQTEDCSSIYNNPKRLEEYDNIFKFNQSNYNHDDTIYKKDDVLHIKYNKIKELNSIESIIEFNVTNITRDYIKKIGIVKVIGYLSDNNIVVKYIGGNDETLKDETFLISSNDIYTTQGKKFKTKIINNTSDLLSYLSENIEGDPRIYLRLFTNNTVSESSIFSIDTNSEYIILDADTSCKSRQIITTEILLRYLNSYTSYKMFEFKISIIGIDNCKIFSVTKCNDSIIYFDCIKEE